LSTGDKTILKKVLREECLPALARQAAYFSMTDVRDWLRHRAIPCPPALLREYLSEFKRIRERTVVIRPKPTTQPHEDHLVAMEGLLVELFMESRALGLLDEGEYFRIFANLAGHSRISLARLLDYARERRPAGLELARHIKEELLKKSALIGSEDAQ
jgi:hypothetical protein